MRNNDPIELDLFYKRLCHLVGLTDLNPVEKVLFLASFESWYWFQSYGIYSAISQNAIICLEGLHCEN